MQHILRKGGEQSGGAAKQNPEQVEGDGPEQGFLVQDVTQSFQ